MGVLEAQGEAPSEASPIPATAHGRLHVPGGAHHV